MIREENALIWRSYDTGTIPVQDNQQIVEFQQFWQESAAK